MRHLNHLPIWRDANRLCQAILRTRYTQLGRTGWSGWTDRLPATPLPNIRREKMHAIHRTPVTTLVLVSALGLAPAVLAEVICDNENVNVRASTPTTDFEIHDDGTVTHRPTGLMWMRCSLGQTWDSTACDEAINAKTYNWQDALQVTQDINSGTSNADNDNAAGFAGHTDWRLPNKNELASIAEQRCWSPAINADVFPNTSGLFWSASPYAGGSGSAWNVGFTYGAVGFGGKSGSSRVRLVRD